MQRNHFSEKEKIEKNLNDTSTKVITNFLGGPPKNPPKFGSPVKIYHSNEEIKIDEDGTPYVGMSIRELKEYESHQSVLSHEAHVDEKSNQNQDGQPMVLTQ